MLRPILNKKINNLLMLVVEESSFKLIKADSRSKNKNKVSVRHVEIKWSSQRPLGILKEKNPPA